MKSFFAIAATVLLIFCSAANAQYGLFNTTARYSTFSGYNLDSQLVYRTVGQLKNFDFTGGGARAAGMGKAFIGVSDDITAGSWNPAGLIVHEKPMLGLSAGSMAPRGTINSASISSGLSGAFSNVTYVGFVSPIRIRGHQFVGSASYGMLTEEYDEGAMDFALVIWAQTGLATFSKFTGPYTRTIRTHNTPYVLNLGFGTRIYKNLSFGLTANVYTGGSVMNRSSMYTLKDFPEFRTGQFQRDTAVGVQEVIDTIKYSGINFTIGLKHTGERLSAGLVIKTPFALKSGYSTTIYDRSYFAGQIVTDNTDTIYRDNNLYKIEFPLIAGAGIGYKVSENLLLALDAELRLFSGRKIDDRQVLKILPGGNTSDSFSTVNPDYRNSFVVRTGAEYTWKTGNSLFPKVPLRAGFALVPTIMPSVTGANAVPVRDSLIYDQLGNPADSVFHFELRTTSSSAAVMYALSGGIGVQWSQIHLDLAYTFSSVNRSQLVGFSMLPNLNGIYPATVSTVKSRNHSLLMTFTGYF